MLQEAQYYTRSQHCVGFVFNMTLQLLVGEEHFFNGQLLLPFTNYQLKNQFHTTSQNAA